MSILSIFMFSKKKILLPYDPSDFRCSSLLNLWSVLIPLIKEIEKFFKTKRISKDQQIKKYIKKST